MFVVPKRTSISDFCFSIRMLILLQFSGVVSTTVLIFNNKVIINDNFRLKLSHTEHALKVRLYGMLEGSLLYKKLRFYTIYFPSFCT